MIISLKKKIFKGPINRCSSSVVIREIQNQPQRGNITSKNAEVKRTDNAKYFVYNKWHATHYLANRVTHLTNGLRDPDMLLQIQ